MEVASSNSVAMMKKLYGILSMKRTTKSLSTCSHVGIRCA